MRSRSRSLVILICLFLIAFKVAASSIFIEAAIERAQLFQNSHISISALEHSPHQDSTQDKQEVHTLFLMSHVTANISDLGIKVPHQSASPIAFSRANDILFTQNFPDSAFKPPKLST